MNEPLVSIVTPMFDSEGTISETYKSIKNQSHSNWEWIVVDDCSNDSSFSLVSNFAKEDSRIKIYKMQKNSGAAKCRNFAIKKARGDFLAFLDADDMWKKEKLKKQLSFMIDNDLEFTYSDYDVLKNKNKIIKYSPKRNCSDFKTLLKRCDIGCLTVMLNIKKIGKIYMPEDCPKREDYATWLDITRNGVTAYKLNETLAIYRLSNNSVSSKKLSMIKYHYNVYRKHEHFGVIKSLWYLSVHSFNKILKKY